MIKVKVIGLWIAVTIQKKDEAVLTTKFLTETYWFPAMRIFVEWCTTKEPIASCFEKTPSGCILVFRMPRFDTSPYCRIVEISKERPLVCNNITKTSEKSRPKWFTEDLKIPYEWLASRRLTRYRGFPDAHKSEQPWVVISYQLWKNDTRSRHQWRYAIFSRVFYCTIFKHLSTFCHLVLQISDITSFLLFTSEVSRDIIWAAPALHPNSSLVADFKN